MRAVLALSTALAGLVACTEPSPMSIENAQVVCTETVREAIRPPSVDVHVGVGSGGHSHAGVSIGVNAGQLSGRSPEEMYAQCVKRRSGKDPVAPLQL